MYVFVKVLNLNVIGFSHSTLVPVVSLTALLFFDFDGQILGWSLLNPEMTKLITINFLFAHFLSQLQELPAATCSGHRADNCHIWHIDFEVGTEPSLRFLERVAKVARYSPILLYVPTLLEQIMETTFKMSEP